MEKEIKKLEAKFKSHYEKLSGDNGSGGTGHLMSESKKAKLRAKRKKKKIEDKLTLVNFFTFFICLFLNH